MESNEVGMSSNPSEPEILSDEEDDAENIEIDLENSVWEFDPLFEFDAPQWFDFSNADEVFAVETGRGAEHDWFMSVKPGHEPKRRLYHSGPDIKSAPASPKTPNGKSRMGPLHLGSPMRVAATAPQSPISVSSPRAVASPRSPNLTTPSSPKPPSLHSRFASGTTQSPRANMSPQRALLGSPSRVASPVSKVEADLSPTTVVEPTRARNLLKSFSVTLMNARAAQEAKEAAKAGSPVTAGAVVPKPATPPVSSLPASIQEANKPPKPQFSFAPPSPIADDSSDNDDSFPSPPPVASRLLSSLLLRSESISPTSNTTEAVPSTSPSPPSQPAAEPAPSGLLGRLGAPKRVVAEEEPVEPIEKDEDEFEELPLPPKLSALALSKSAPSIAKGTAPTSTRPTASAKIPARAPVKATGAATRASAQAQPSKPAVPKPSVPVASVKPKPSLSTQPARKTVQAAAAPQPPKQPSTITKRRAKVVFTPASSTAQDENTDSNDAWQPSKQPAQVSAAARRVGKLGVELDEAVVQRIREHNKNFAPKPTYEPRKHSLHDIRTWERSTGLQWYALSPQSRERANEQIAAMHQASQQM